jgi:adenylate kinase family enzyme
LLRAESKSTSEEGLLISECIDNGKIVPGHITIRLLKKAVESYDVDTQFLIDGFPREMQQCIDFEREITPCQFCLFFDCPLESKFLKFLKF